jgi:hypothetical protein
MNWWKLIGLGEQVRERQKQWIQEMKQVEQMEQQNMGMMEEQMRNAPALAKAHASAREAQIKLQDLQRAVSSIVLRLKVLDVEALEKDLGEDGTIPLRLALSELKELVRAYDGMPKSNIPDCDGLTTSVSPYLTSIGGIGNAYYTCRRWHHTDEDDAEGADQPADGI